MCIDIFTYFLQKYKSSTIFCMQLCKSGIKEIDLARDALTSRGNEAAVEGVSIVLFILVMF